MAEKKIARYKLRIQRGKKSQQCKLGSARREFFLFLNRNSFFADFWMIFLRIANCNQFYFLFCGGNKLPFTNPKMCKQKKKMKIQYLSCIIDHTQVRRWRTENCIGWKKATFIHNVTRSTYCRGVKTFSTKQNPELYVISWCFSNVPLHCKLKHTNVLYISV